MQEIAEFRVLPDQAERLLAPDCGRVVCDELGRPSVRIVTTPTNSLLFQRIVGLEHQLRSESKGSFFLGWSISRKYSAHEIESAELFLLHVTSWFEPAGSECGTRHDDSGKCPLCGGGRRQVGELILDLRRPAKTKQIASSIGDEIIVSQQLKDLMLRNRVTGCGLQPVKHRTFVRDQAINITRVAAGKEVVRLARQDGVEPFSVEYYTWAQRPDLSALVRQADEEYFALVEKRAQRAKPPAPWYQLTFTSSSVRIVPPTRFGVNPADEDPEGQYRCPRALEPRHVAGFTILSELHIDRKSYDGSDICCTADLAGQFAIPTKIDLRSIHSKAGIATYIGRNRPFLIVSPRFRRLLVENKIRGVSFEVAHLV